MWFIKIPDSSNIIINTLIKEKINRGIDINIYILCDNKNKCFSLTL